MQRICKHCKQSFNISDKPKGWMANHSRWCDYNPKRSDYVHNMEKARANITDHSRKKQREGIKAAHAKGKYDHLNYAIFLGKTHTEEAKKKISEAALKSKHRRLRKGVVIYNGVMLDSSWELALAKRLDELQINWTRPEPIEWVDENSNCHNYFADFYLPDYDLYLDPKNPHAIKVQKQKLECLLKQHTNIRILSSLDECNNFNMDE